MLRLNRSPLTHAMFALALLVRGMAVPGYMAGDSGWPVQLCPEGLSSASVALIFGSGDHHHVHHHAHHSPAGIDPDPGSSADDSSRSDPSNGSSSAERCALGGSSVSALLPGSQSALSAPCKFTNSPPPTPPGAVRVGLAAFQARAPPYPLMLT